MTLTFILLIAAVVLSLLGVIRSRGSSEVAWAVLLVSLVLILPRL